MKKHFGCPVQATPNVLAGKWKVLIVWHLSFGHRRFAEIPELADIADHNDDRFFARLDAAEKRALHDLLIKLVTHHQIRDVPVE